MKRICIALMIVIIIFTNNCSATDIVINNEKIQFSNPVLNLGGVTYVPLRELFEKGNFEVNWLEMQNLIDIKKRNYPLYEETLECREGQIEKTIKYRFRGDTKFTYDSFSGYMRDYTDNQKYARIINAERAAKIGSVYLETAMKSVPKDSSSIVVCYSSELNAWAVSFAPTDKNVYSHRAAPVVILDANDGRFLKIFYGD